MLRDARLAAASALLDDIAPAEGVETMLAIQMVATHEASMECLRRAMAGGPLPEGRDDNLKHAEKLLALYARQMDVLGKHRARESRQAAERKPAEQAGREGNGVGKPQPVRFRHVFFNAEEWWAARAHVIDPRIVLAKTYTRQDVLDAGLSEVEAEAVAEKVAEAVAAKLPTIDGKPYI